MHKALLIKVFNDKLNEIIGSDIPVLREVKRFVIESGGKRIRPFTHFYFSRILGYEGDECKDVGAVGELIHAASLLHDDVIDSGETRRGKPTINSVYNNKTAILSGDFLLACGLDHLSTLPHASELLGVFTRVIRKLAEGELLQMEWESNYSMPEEVYDRIIYGKTAVLFGAMTESAAILSGLSAEKRSRHREFGERMGRIFQVRDDFLDYFGNEKSNGKELFQDFQRGIVTRPVILLRSIISSEDRNNLEKAWATGEIRRSEKGKEMWNGLAQKFELSVRLSREIEAEIGDLIRFLGNFPKSKYSSEIMDRLSELHVRAS